MNANVSAHKPSLQEVVVPGYDEKFEILMSNFLECAPLTVRFHDIFFIL